MKTVAMENTQRSWHCERRHSSSSDNYVFSPKKIAIFKETIQTDMEREGKACKARSLKIQSTRKALRVINKMAEKNSFIVEEACWFAVTMTRPEKDWGRSIAVLYGGHALHQLSATRVWGR